MRVQDVSVTATFMTDEETARRSQHRDVDCGAMSTMAAVVTMPDPAPTELLTTGHVKPADKGTGAKVSGDECKNAVYSDF